MITRATVICLGLSQLVVWGISYYQVGVFGEQIAATHGWNLSYVHGGFSIALLVMGLTSPVIGRAIERHGGRPVMTAGSLTLAIGCVGVALAENLLAYYVAWVVMGVAMRPMMMGIYRADVVTTPIVMLFFVVILSALYPALKAAFIGPLEAMHHQ